MNRVTRESVGPKIVFSEIVREPLWDLKGGSLARSPGIVWGSFPLSQQLGPENNGSDGRSHLRLFSTSTSRRERRR
jgi:hypothetical protein